MPLHQTLGSLHGVRMVAGAGLHRACGTRRASPEPPWTGLGNLQFCSGKCTSYDQNWGKDWELSIHQILGIEWLFFVQNGPSGDFTGWLRKRAVADYWHLGWWNPDWWSQESPWKLVGVSKKGLQNDSQTEDCHFGTLGSISIFWWVFNH